MVTRRLFNPSASGDATLFLSYSADSKSDFFSQPQIVCGSKTASLILRLPTKGLLFSCECIVKVIFVAVNLPQQITLQFKD